MFTAGRHIIIGVFLIVVGLGEIRAAEPNAATIPPDLNTAAVRQAANYMVAHPADTAALDAFLATKGIKAGTFRKEIGDIVSAMTSVVAKGVDFGSEGFWDLYRDATKAPPGSGNQPPPATVVAPAATPRPAPANVVASTVPAQGAGASDSTRSSPTKAATDASLETTALKLFAAYADEAGNNDSDAGFERFLQGQGLDSGKLRDLIVRVRMLQKESGAKAGSKALEGLLLGNVATKTSAGEVSAPVKASASKEVLDADQLTYDRLNVEEREWKVKIAALTSTTSNAQRSPDERKEAGLALLAARDALNEVLAHQNWLRAKATAKTLDSAAKAKPDDTKARAAAEAAAAEEALAKASYEALHKDNAGRQEVLAADRAKFDALKTDAKKFSDKIAEQKQLAADQQKIIEDKQKTDKERAAAESQKRIALATVEQTQKKLNANVAQQKVLRAKFAKSQAEIATQADPFDLKAQSAFEEAKVREASAKDIQEALDRDIRVQATDPSRASFGFTHAGLRMLSPYSIVPEMDSSTPAKPTGRKLLKSDANTKVGGFFEFVYTNVWAWRPGRQINNDGEPLKTSDGMQHILAYWAEPPNRNQIMNWFDNSWDTIGRVSFEFGKDDQPSAATITGSGDFNAEITFDRHLARGISMDDHMAFSGSATLSIAGVTDRSTFKVHPRLLMGGSVALSFDDPFSTGSRKVWFRMQGGPAIIDGLVFDDTARSTSILLTHGDVPKYEHKHAWAFETELFWPLRETAMLAMGTRLYGDTRPAPWSLYLSLTVPVTSIADSLMPK